jgi:hypothetical protein
MERRGLPPHSEEKVNFSQANYFLNSLKQQWNAEAEKMPEGACPYP